MNDINRTYTQSEPGAPGPEGAVPLCVPYIRGNEWRYIKECLDTNWVSSVGSFVDRFEESISAQVGTKYAVATINGTAALHVALLVAGVGSDDEVLVSSLSFIAPANAIRYVGAWPVFMDSDPLYWQMDPGKVADFLEKRCTWRDGGLVNSDSGRRLKAILPVHILGHSCDMNPIIETARKYGLSIIEDATESLGAKYQDRMVGHLGDVACLSFNGNKLLTTGGGGMIVTDNADWADRARYLTTQAKDDAVEYIHNEIGFNYRLGNIQAAMGLAQMEQLAEFIASKRATAQSYDEGFRETEGVHLMSIRPDTDPVFWLYTILLDQNITLADRKKVIGKLNEMGVGVRPLWHPIHSLPPYRDCQAFQIEHADSLYRRGVSLPSSVGLEAHEQERCIAAVKQCVGW